MVTLSPQPQASVSLGLRNTNLAASLVDLVVDLGADQEQHRLGLDQDGDALVLDHLVQRIGGLGVFEDVFLAGAAAVLHADAQARVGLLGLGP